MRLTLMTDLVMTDLYYGNKQMLEIESCLLVFLTISQTSVSQHG